MYEENEILILQEDVGKKDNIIPKGTEVEFIKVMDNPSDLSQSLVAFKHNDRLLVTKEVNVKPKDEAKVRNAFDELNRGLIERNPELIIYHPNPVIRYYHRFIKFIKSLLKR
jgi:putative cell wall-binding protein